MLAEGLSAHAEVISVGIIALVSGSVVVWDLALKWRLPYPEPIAGMVRFRKAWTKRLGLSLLVALLWVGYIIASPWIVYTAIRTELHREDAYRISAAGILGHSLWMIPMMILVAPLALWWGLQDPLEGTQEPG